MKRVIEVLLRALIAYFILFIVLHIFNLDRMPLVWFDEVMGLDPAVNAVFKDGFVSKIWPQQGTEFRFMAYMPLRFVFHQLHLRTLPFEVFWQRLPWAVYFLGSAVFLYMSLRSQIKIQWIILLIVFVYINDRTVFEVARSMRVDPLSLLFLSFTAYGFYSRRIGLQAFGASAMVFIHPNLWVLALIVFFDASIRFNRKRNAKGLLPNVLWLIPIGGFLLFGFSIGWEVQGFMAQLFEHGADHDASGGIVARIKAHFIDRFWPYYNSQPWMPLLIYAALALAVYRTFKKDYRLWSIVLIATHLFWLIALAPFYRYDAVLMLVSILSLIPELKGFSVGKREVVLAYLLLLLMPINAMGRHVVALVQRTERDPQPVIEWLQSQLGDENVLIMGHDVAYYAVATDLNKDYMMFNLQPSKFKYEDYKKHYVLLQDQAVEYQGLSNVQPSVYLTKYQERPDWLQKRLKHVQTYQSLWLYEVPNKESWNEVMLRLDRENHELLKGGH